MVTWADAEPTMVCAANEEESKMTIIASLSISLDGFYTGEDASSELPMGRGGNRLHEWFAHDVADRAQLTADEILAAEFERTGAMIMGRDSYDHAEALWGESPPFEMPIFVVTHRSREDDVRKGTTFTFVDSMDTAIERALQAANGKAVGLHGGGAIRQGLQMRVLQELQLHLVPVLLGSGRRLFSRFGDEPIAMETLRVAEGPSVTHLKYALPEM